MKCIENHMCPGNAHHIGCPKFEPGPATKPPIYPVEVIEVACRALEAFAALKTAGVVTSGSVSAEWANTACASAILIVRDGLASHEKAIRGES